MPESLGKTLKRIRESKSLSQEEVSERSRIPKNIISTIEEDRISEIKSIFYAKSFVKTYAGFLGAFNEPAVKEYLSGTSQQQKRPEQVSRPASAPVAEPKSEKKSISTAQPKKMDFSLAQYKYQIAAVVVGIIAFLVLSAAIGQVNKFIKNVHAKRQSRPAIVKKEAPKKEEKPAVKDAPKPAAAAKKEPVNEKREYIEVEIMASDNTWLQVMTDGDLIFTGAFKKGSKDTWKAKKEIKIEVGNSGGIRMTINGKPADFSGKRGEKKEFIITKDGIK